MNEHQPETCTCVDSLLQINFHKAQERVFSEKKGKILLGGEEIQNELLEVLKDQAKYLEKSQLLEILNATIVNEAANLAVIQSGSSGSIERDVIAAKMLHHWNFVLQNMIKSLANAKIVDKK